MNKWQPIETAPSETDLLLYCPEGIARHYTTDDMSPYICIGRKSAVHIDYGPFNEWVSTDVVVQIVEYGEYTGVVDESERQTVNPTHWMPLPEPPEQEDGR